MKPHIFVVSLGCPRNLVDTEILLGTLKNQGFKISEKPNNCIAVINTCGFIEDAKAESVDMILELASLKKEGKLKLLIVTGCLSQRYTKDLMDEIPEIDGIFGSSTFIDIPKHIKRLLAGEKAIVVEKTPRFLYHHRMPRAIVTPRHSVYVKIQEGCMNFCSYCVIPRIRGRFRSRNMTSVIEEVRALRRTGAQEINIIGQDTTLYGIDRYKCLKLADVLKKVSRIMKTGWVRFLYTHPAHYNQRLIDVVRDEPALCKYFDLPIQHINDIILRKMNRHVTKKNIITLIEKIRRNIPRAAIRTSVIVGFPGETDRHFKELKQFIKEVRFERLGAFVYSREEGSRAFHMPRQIPENEKQKRLGIIMETQKRVSQEHNAAFLGQCVRVLVDEKDTSQPNRYIGRTEHDAPEVDGTVYLSSEKTLHPGNFVNVRIEDTLEYDLVGTVQYEHRK